MILFRNKSHKDISDFNKTNDKCLDEWSLLKISECLLDFWECLERISIPKRGNPWKNSNGTLEGITWLIAVAIGGLEP